MKTLLYVLNRLLVKIPMFLKIGTGNSTDLFPRYKCIDNRNEKYRKWAFREQGTQSKRIQEDNIVFNNVGFYMVVFTAMINRVAIVEDRTRTLKELHL